MLYAEGADRLNYYVNNARKNHGITLFELEHPEKKFSKMDTVIPILGNATNAMFESKQRHATALLVLNRPFTRKFFEDCLAIATESNYKYLDDSKSESSELPGFIDSIHNQFNVEAMRIRRYSR